MKTKGQLKHNSQYQDTGLESSITPRLTENKFVMFADAAKDFFTLNITLREHIPPPGPSSNYNSHKWGTPSLHWQIENSH